MLAARILRSGMEIECEVGGDKVQISVFRNWLAVIDLLEHVLEYVVVSCGDD